MPHQTIFSEYELTFFRSNLVCFCEVFQSSWVEKHLPVFPNLIRWKIQTANWHTFYFSIWVYQRRNSLCVLEECKRLFAMSDYLYKCSQLNCYAQAVPSVRSAKRHVFIPQERSDDSSWWGEKIVIWCHLHLNTASQVPDLGLRILFWGIAVSIFFSPGKNTQTRPPLTILSRFLIISQSKQIFLDTVHLE